MKLRFLIVCSNIDNANEMSKGWILTECGLESVESSLILNINCPKEIESAAMKPVLAYQSTDTERLKVFRFPYPHVVLICVGTDVINDEEPELCRKRRCAHVVGERCSRRRFGGEH